MGSRIFLHFTNISKSESILSVILSLQLVHLCYWLVSYCTKLLWRKIRVESAHNCFNNWHENNIALQSVVNEGLEQILNLFQMAKLNYGFDLVPDYQISLIESYGY